MVDNEWDLHEVFVKRSQVAPSHQELIMVLENCIPLQHKAHIAVGNTHEALSKCALPMFRNIGATKICEWYMGLQEHISVNKGIFIPARDMRMYQITKMIELGARIEGVDLGDYDWTVKGNKGKYDIRSQIGLQYQDRRKKWREAPPKEHGGVFITELSQWLREGHHADYLIRTLGIDTSYWP